MEHPLNQILREPYCIYGYSKINIWSHAANIFTNVLAVGLCSNDIGPFITHLTEAAKKEVIFSVARH